MDRCPGPCGEHLAPVRAGSIQKENAPFDRRRESGPWFDASSGMDRKAAWEYLHDRSKRSTDNPRPYCVYVHVPFCASICSYCGLYTRAVRGDADTVFDEYLLRISDAIETHPNAHGGQAPTTVHFGGGTPLHLGLARFAALTRSLQRAFGNASSCEWAVETTTSSIQPDTVSALGDLGFQRIHLGIQTLDNRVRKQYRRHESGEMAVEKIRFLIEQGFHCSVDLIIGFDDSTEAILLDDLQRLHDAGVRVFSICELWLRGGRKITARRRQDSLRNYGYWSIIWQFMQRAGLQPIHLGQFGQSKQSNLYYTHPARGEDCVAIGPYAHGSAGRLYYSNRLAPDYYAAVRMGAVPIETAVWYDDRLELILALERELLAHHVQQATLKAVAIDYPEFDGIFRFWQEWELLRQSQTSRTWDITMEGSWFIGNMIEQARQMATQGERNCQ